MCLINCHVHQAYDDSATKRHFHNVLKAPTKLTDPIEPAISSVPGVNTSKIMRVITISPQLQLHPLKKEQKWPPQVLYLLCIGGSTRTGPDNQNYNQVLFTVHSP